MMGEEYLGELIMGEEYSLPNEEGRRLRKLGWTILVTIFCSACLQGAGSSVVMFGLGVMVRSVARDDWAEYGVVVCATCLDVENMYR